jgi:glucose-6-phosphate-specific signal transduction histidine kinase
MLQVKDDGVGFDPKAPTAGFGLAGMRERVYLPAVFGRAPARVPQLM